MFVLNLAHFFTRLYGEGSRAANSKLTYVHLNSVESFLYCLCSRLPTEIGAPFTRCKGEMRVKKRTNFKIDKFL